VAEEVAEEVVEEVEEEVAEEEDKQILQLHLTSDSVETPQKYSRETEKRWTASFPNLSDTTWPTLEFQNLTPGSERSSSLAPISKDPLSTNGLTER
jgi:hypothetical protein